MRPWPLVAVQQTFGRRQSDDGRNRLEQKLKWTPSGRIPVNPTIKNVPDELVERLRERARRNRRSLQKEILVLLEEALRPKRLTVQEVEEQLHAMALRTPEGAAQVVRSDRDAR